MLKSGVTPLASQKDLDEVIAMHPDPSTEEQESQMQRCCSSSSIYESAPEIDSQDEWDQHLLEAADGAGNAFSREPGAQPEGQQSVYPSATSGSNCFTSMRDKICGWMYIERTLSLRKYIFMPTLNLLKKLLKKLLKEGEWFSPSEIYKRVSAFLIEILDELKQDIENPSTAMDQDLIPEKKVKLLKKLWDGMHPLDRIHARTVLFVVISQLQRATLLWGPEENLILMVQVREIVQKLFVFVRTTRSDHESISHLQRDVGNHIWRLNRLDKYIKSFEALSLELVDLNIVLLSSSIEQIVVLWPSLENYAHGRGSNPVLLSGGNSDFGIQTLTKVFESYRNIASSKKSTEWLHLALGEMLSEQKEWAGIVSSRVTSRHGGYSADVGTEYIGSILKEALKTTSCLLGLGTDPGKINEDDGDETCSMFCIEYLNGEKFGDAGDVILDINLLVSLNHLLLRLRWSLDEVTEDYVPARECEEGAERDTQIHKRRGYFRTWKEVFSLDSLRLLPRAWRSVTYAANSRREIDRDLCMLYEELNRLRADRLDGESHDRRRSKTSLINAHSFAAMVYNEGWQLLWKMHEALNESSPQLFLQLVIANMQLVDGEAVGLLTFIGILVSLASFSWTLHLCHYLGHYDGLKNNFKLLHRATDFVAHFVIVGCRFVVLSSVMALSPLWFSVVAFFYLGFRFIFLYYCSPDRGRYREITKESYNTLWMVYRLLITPYNLSVWCIDTYDDLFYHVETFVLALYWPFPLDCGHPLADYRWMITATILILNFILLPVLLKLNEAMFEKSPLCEDHDPFPIRLSIREDLKAGKTRVERLFGSTRGGGIGWHPGTNNRR